MANFPSHWNFNFAQDNVSMHIAMEAIDYFIANNVSIVTYPPNTTDELQGLDKVMFKSLKTRYENDMIIQRRVGPNPTKRNMPA